MESDDDYETFSLPSPSPSPKHRRLKRLKKSSTVEPVHSTTTTTDDYDVAQHVPRSETLPTVEASVTRAVADEIEIDDGKVKDMSSVYDDDNYVNSDLKEPEEEFGLDADVAEDDVDVVETGDAMEDHSADVAEEDADVEEHGDDVAETGDDVEETGDGERVVRMDRKETKRALDFNDDDGGVNEIDGREEDKEKEGDEDDEGNNINKKKGKKNKKLKGDSEEPEAKMSKRREAKERKAHLDQLHVESQRILRETRGVSFKPVPLVQKPISSILERIRQRKLEVSKKFCQSVTNDSCKEDGDRVMVDGPKSVETEVSDISESAKEEKVMNVLNGDQEPDDVGMDEDDACGEPKGDANACSQKDMDVETTPALRAPVDDTQELFGDSQTSDSIESENDESGEQASSSQEEEIAPSLLTMKLKFDSAPDDICDEEENDKENVDPYIKEHSSPKGDPVKAFVDDEAEEEEDSDNDRMLFGDDDEDGDEDDIEELNKMIATGYKERPIDLETRNELHQKWLEEKDAAGTDDLLRRLNVASRLREASLLSEDDEEDVKINDNNDDNAGDDEDGDDDEDDVDEDVERPRVARMNSKRAKELIAQMFNDKDDLYVSSDDEETKKILVRERHLNKDKEKSRLVSPVKDEDSREVFSFVKKLNTVPEGRKKANATSFFDTMLTGGNSNSSSKSSFLNRMSNNSLPTSSKQGKSSSARSFIFGKDDSNSRSSISMPEDTPDIVTAPETQIKKATSMYKSSQSQCRSSTQTTELDSETDSSSFFKVLKQSYVQSTVHNSGHNFEFSQSVLAAFKIPKKPTRIQRRV